MYYSYLAGQLTSIWELQPADPDEYERICITLDLSIDVPAGDALDSLHIALPNSNIEVLDALTLEDKLALASANGNVLVQNVTAGTVSVATANGNTDGYLHSLAKDLSVSSANGDNQWTVGTAIGEDSRIALSSANGKISLQLVRICK